MLAIAADYYSNDSKKSSSICYSKRITNCLARKESGRPAMRPLSPREYSGDDRRSFRTKEHRERRGSANNYIANKKERASSGPCRPTSSRTHGGHVGTALQRSIIAPSRVLPIIVHRPASNESVTSRELRDQQGNTPRGFFHK